MKVAAIGVDSGSTTWKAVAVDSGGTAAASIVEPSEPRIEEQTRRGIDALRARTGCGPDVPVGATGYGRKRIFGAAAVVTEISCHARGCFHAAREGGLLIDVGGQDTKAIRIGGDGVVLDFVMNDKCAAGTGRFIEIMLNRLGVPYDRLGGLCGRHAEAAGVTISSTCTVFAETEVISMVAEGASVEKIVLAIHRSLAERVGTLAARLAAESPRIFLSGGVSQNKLFVEALGIFTKSEISVLPEPQIIGALGAALAVLKVRSAECGVRNA